MLHLGQRAVAVKQNKYFWHAYDLHASLRYLVLVDCACWECQVRYRRLPASAKNVRILSVSFTNCCPYLSKLTLKNQVLMAKGVHYVDNNKYKLGCDDGNSRFGP